MSGTSLNKSKLWIVAIITLSLVLTVRLLSPNRHQGPIYQGKPLRYWVQSLGNKERESQARLVLASVGIEAVPHLLKMTCEQTTLHERLYAKTVQTVPQMESLLPQPTSMGELAYQTLWIMGEKCIPTLVEQFNSGDDETREASAAALVPHVTKSRQALDVVLEAARTETDEDLRMFGVISMGQFVFEARQDANYVVPEDVLHCLAQLAAHKDADTRDWAVRFLQKLGTKAKPAIPVLLEELANKNPDARESITNALKGIDPETYP